MEKTINIKGNQLTCTIEGNPQNPAIILIHDWASHRGVWQQTISAFNSKYYCIAVDLLGFGSSDKPDDADYSLPVQGQRILSLADKLGLTKFSLIGHSMGGQIGILIASVLAPPRIEKLVLVNGIITGKFSLSFENYIPSTIDTLRNLPFLYTISNSLVNFSFIGKKVFNYWFYNFNFAPFESWRKDRLVACNPACFLSMPETLNAIKAVDLTQNLRKIKAQTLIISAKQDAMIPMDQSLLAQTLIPNNDLAVIEKCGHFPMYEKPGNYLKALNLIL